MFDAFAVQQRLVDRGQAISVDGDFGPKSYAALLAWVAAKPAPSTLMLSFGTACARYFPQNAITSALRIAHNIAQAAVETWSFSRTSENLNYSPAGLIATFGLQRISSADAQRLGRQPGEQVVPPDRQAAIADLVYGGAFGRLNLGNTAPADGWTYRGRGWKQLTGRANYARIASITQLPVVAQPDLLLNPDTGVRAGCLFWTANGCNAFADADDITGLTRKVNGGLNGLAEREAALARAKLVLVP